MGWLLAYLSFMLSCVWLGLRRVVDIPGDEGSWAGGIEEVLREGWGSAAKQRVD